MPRKHQNSKPPAKREPKKAPKQPHIEVAVLEVTSWVGSGICFAEHYYGKLKGSLAKKGEKSQWTNIQSWEEIEVEYTLTAKEAAALNKEAAEGGMLAANYQVGEMSTRFFSEEKLMVCAIELARSLGYDALVRGSYSCCSPQKILFGPKMDQLNAIWERYEALFEDSNDPPGVEPYEKEWAALAFSVGITDHIGGPQLGRR